MSTFSSQKVNKLPWPVSFGSVRRPGKHPKASGEIKEKPLFLRQHLLYLALPVSDEIGMIVVSVAQQDRVSAS